MMFVPFVPPQASSARSQELARELEDTVARFRQRYPDVSAFEVRAALRQARCSAGVSPKGPLLAAAVGMTVALGVSLLFFQRHTTPEAPVGAPSATPWMMPAIAVGIVLIGVLALVISRR